MDAENQTTPELITQIVQPEVKKCNHVPIIIILTILAVGGFVFGGIELWQNNVLREEKAELESTVAESSKNNKSESRNNVVLEYEYVDDNIPPTTYKIKLNYDTGELYAHTYNSCSAVDCDGDSFENTISLSDQELEKISTITRKNNYNKGRLSNALSSLVCDTDVMAQIDDDSDNTSWEYYEDYDLNGDGAVTYREFGNNYLDRIIEES